VQTFREDREHETEFVTISYWDGMDEMKALTGGDPAAAHHLERDPEFLVARPGEVQVLRLLSSHGVMTPALRPPRR
jgi:heme-degrading monooxygenase HmoA